MFSLLPQVTHASAGEVERVKMGAEIVAPNQSKETIRGVVLDDRGEPLPGASVLLKGTQNGTVTDLDGKFILTYYSADVKKPQLVVSFIGMTTRTVDVVGGKDLNVRLTPEVNDLDEVVVIGYGTAKAKDLTGSVSRLNEKDIEMAPMTSNIAGMLQGRAAGVNVMIASASPTSPVSVVIRGQSSL